MGSSPIVIDPHILLPRPGIDLHKFAVIACDQFTSQPEYWRALEHLVGEAPSALRMIFPEAYLNSVDGKTYIDGINDTIAAYLKTGVLQDIGSGFVLVERSTPFAKRRLGLMIAIDLESYSFEKGAQTPVRASEATIVARIPPRLKIRENAPIEIPHVLVLFDDPNDAIIGPIYEKKADLRLVYDFELNQNGGHLRGYHIKDTTAIIRKFNALKEKNGLMFIVGDGNHSLATAKAHWDKIKVALSAKERLTHPARHSLVEAINIHDEGLMFEPIHRVVFGATPDFIASLKSLLDGTHEGYWYSKSSGRQPLTMPSNGPHAYKIVQDHIDRYLKDHPQAHVDYIHGIADLKEVADGNEGAIGIVMPALTKGDIFDYIAKGDVLPRKCFSMGHAVEKRYYLEAKTIK